MWFNVAYSSNFEQKNFNCQLVESSSRTQVSILKEYNSEFLLGFEKSDFGSGFSFMKINKDKFHRNKKNLISYSLEYEYEVVHVSTFELLNNNSGKITTDTYRLTRDQINEIKQLNSKFSNFNDIADFEFTDKELKDEIVIFDKIEEILSLSKKEVVGDPLIYNCNINYEEISTLPSILNLAENDRFTCRKDGVSSIIKILEIYYDRYVVLFTEFNENRFLNLGTYTAESLEFISLEKNFLTVNMITPPVDGKLSNFIFTVKLTNEELIELKKYATKFDKVDSGKFEFNLTDEELSGEIDLHNKKIEILGNIMNSEEKLQNQGMTSTTLICKIV